MSLKAYKINSNLAEYTDEEFSAIETLIAQEGIFDVTGTDQDFEVTESTPNAMTVDVNTGSALVEYTKSSVTWKVVVNSNAVEVLSISANTSGSNRVDAIIVHLKQVEANALKNNVPEVKVVLGTGVAALSDSDINTIEGDTNWYRLADITVPDSAATITNSDITDTRARVTLDALPTDGAANYVTLTGNQSVAGVKTFGSFPITPSAAPTTDYQVANKKYADDLFVATVGAIEYTALEAIAENDAIALMENELQHYTQLGDGNLSIGITNSTRRRAIKVTPTVTSSTLTTMQFRGKEAAGSSTMTLTVSIQGDNAGEPDGTPITNGTANTIATSGWTTTYADRTATWASPPTLTAGTTYWIVFEVDLTHATEYIQIGYGSNAFYATFTTMVYDLDTATWGSSSTTQTPWFWFDSQVKLLGMGVVVCDANLGPRAWKFIGFADDTVAANVTVNAKYELATGFTDLVPGEDYYISTTAGEVTLTVPSGTTPSYKVGRAVSTTVMKVEIGQKYMYGTMTFNATEAFDAMIWFKPKLIRITATCDGNEISAGSISFTTLGVNVGGTGTSVYVNDVPVSFSSSAFQSRDSSGPKTSEGVISDINNIAFTLTDTEGSGGASANILVIWEAIA